MTHKPSRSERIISPFVQAIGRAVVGNIIGRHQNPVIDTSRRDVYQAPNRIFNPVNELIQRTLRILPSLDLPAGQEDNLRLGLYGSIVHPEDSVVQANLKLDTVNSIRRQVASMAKGAKNVSRRNSATPSSGAVALAGRGGYGLRNLGADLTGIAGAGVGGVLGGLTGLGAGSLPGGLTGAYVGQSLGHSMGQELGRSIFGRGAYTVAKNTIIKSGMVLGEGTEVPSFVDSNRYTRITHREFVQDIVVPATPTAFTNTTFVINPGNATLFPWLATIASCYQQYEIMGMVIMFKSTSTDFSTSGALGSVVLATNYDVLESPYASKVIMENSQYAVSAKPSLSQMHAIECDPKLTSTNVKYIRNASSSTTASQDARFYDHGLFELATVGLSSTAGQVLGELWVTYDIKLLKPEIVNSAFLLTGQRIVSGGTTSKTAIFGTTPVSFGATYASATTNTLTFSRVGQFLLELESGGTVLADPVETAVGLTFTQVINMTTGTPSMINLYTVVVTAPNQTLAFDFTSSTTVTASAARIASYAASTA